MNITWLTVLLILSNKQGWYLIILPYRKAYLLFSLLFNWNNFHGSYLNSAWKLFMKTKVSQALSAIILASKNEFWRKLANIILLTTSFFFYPIEANDL